MRAKTFSKEQRDEFLFARLEAEERLAAADAALDEVKTPSAGIPKAEMTAFRLEHAETKRRREAEFAARCLTGAKWLDALEGMKAFRSEHAEIKLRREAEFSASQRAVKQFVEAELEYNRARKALAIAERRVVRAEKNPE